MHDESIHKNIWHFINKQKNIEVTFKKKAKRNLNKTFVAVNMKRFHA